MTTNSAQEWDDIASARQSGDSLLAKTLYPNVLESVSNIIKSGESIVDFGCGTGDFCRLLSQQGYLANGYDPSGESIAVAQQTYQNLAFNQSTQDVKPGEVVVSNLVLCTLDDAEFQSAVSEIKSLSTSGKYIISVCHPCFDTEPEGVVSSRTIPIDVRYEDTFTYTKKLSDGFCMHDIHRPLGAYGSLFAQHNLAIIDMKESNTLGTEHKPDFLTFVLEDYK